MKKADLEMYLDAKVQIVLKNNFRFRGFIKELKEDCLVFNDSRDGLILMPYDDLRLVKFFTANYPEADQYR